jgi:hypothetical protein
MNMDTRTPTTLRHAPAAAALLLAALLAALLGARTSAGSDRLLFTTSGQSLWGPRPGVTEKTFRAELLDESIVDSIGRIVRVDVDVDNSTAQAAWEQAVQTCDDREYCHDFGFPVGRRCISPTRSQCINGATLEILGVDIVTIRGIGPKPAGSIKKPFDVGAALEWEARLLWGVGGGISVDEGSVEVEYPTEALIEVVGEDLAPGDEFVIRTGEVPGDVRMRSVWPHVDGYIDTFLDSVLRLEARAAGPDTSDGSQIDVRERFLYATTGGEKHKELAGFHAGTDGLQIRLLDEPVFETDEGIEHGVSVPIFTVPGIAEIGFPLLELGLYFPKMATPTPEDFEGLSVNGIFDGTRITNFVSPGRREIEVAWGVVNDGHKDPDVGRFDIDIDVLSALTMGAPLGIDASLGETPIGALLEVEGNALDVDAALFFAFEKEISFEPRLVVELHFSQPTMVETFPGSGEFREALSKTVPVGVELRAIHPGGELTIEPVYSLRENRFVNDTDLVLSPAIQETIFQLKLGGKIYDWAGSQIGIPENMAALQLTFPLTGEPLKLADMNFLDDAPEAQFSLGGFEDIAGTPVSIAAGGVFTRGNANGDASFDISDPIFALRWLFGGGAKPPCLAAGNANGDGTVDVADASFLLNFLFLSGPAPAAPYPACGAGTSEADRRLGCETGEACR